MINFKFAKTLAWVEENQSETLQANKTSKVANTSILTLKFSG